MEQEMSTGKKRDSLSFCVLLCLMSSFFGLLGVSLGVQAVQQGLTLGYSQTQGTITASRIEETKANKRRTNGQKDTSSSQSEFKVLYVYDVDGRSYTSSRLFHGLTVGNRDMARELSRRFPLNARVPVYYAAGNPSQPVLLRAPEGINLFSLLVSFSLLTCVWWSWYALIQEIRRRSRGVLTFVREGRTHVRWGLGLEGWFVLMLLALLASNLLPSTLILSLSWGGLALFFAVLVSASAFVESWRQSRIRSGKLDLILDEPRGVLSLPAMRLVGSQTWRQLPLSRIQRCRVEKDPGGRKSKGFPDWVLVLSTRDEVSGLEVHAVKWSFEDRLEALWSWLKQRPELKHVDFTSR